MKEEAAPVATAGILLASGRSARFGDRDKLLADLAGAPVASYAAAAARDARFSPRLAVVAKGAAALADILSAYGFSTVENVAPEAGMGDSLALGARTALAIGARRGVVLLADMPMVTAEILTALAKAGEARDVVFSVDGEKQSPPAFFSAAGLQALTTLTGDQGARRIVDKFTDQGRLQVPATTLVDIDRPEDLQSVEALMRRGST